MISGQEHEWNDTIAQRTREIQQFGQPQIDIDKARVDQTLRQHFRQIRCGIGDCDDLRTCASSSSRNPSLGSNDPQQSRSGERREAQSVTACLQNAGAFHEREFQLCQNSGVMHIEPTCAAQFIGHPLLD